MKPPKIVLATFGSHGDVHPFLAVALVLKQRGAHPVIAAAEQYRGKITRAGIDFHALRPDHTNVERQLGLSRAQIVRKVGRSPAFLLRKMILPYLREAYDDSVAALHDADVAVTHMAAYATKIAAEKLKIPHLGVALQPMIFLSRFDPPAVHTLPTLTQWIYRHGPKWSGAFLSFGKAVSRTWARPIDRLRRELSLAPAPAHPLFEGQFSAEGALALYSPVLGRVQPDYPAHTYVVGFAFYDDDESADPAEQAALLNFANAGAPPLVFTLGTSAVNDADAFVEASLAAARALQRRAVVVLDASRQRVWQQRVTAEDVLIASYIPYSQVFPLAAAIIHHGGIGTTAQALRAGVPQLIAPYLVDQPDNAARVVRLGVGRSIPLKRYQPKLVEKELRTLLTDTRYAARAQVVREEILREDGAARAAEIILRLIKSAA